MGIIRNQYMGRTFIEPTEQIRNMGVRLKLNVNRALVKGSVSFWWMTLWFEDNITQDQRDDPDAGAAEVHFRIASPPTAWPCFYGVDTPQREKLLAATMSEEEMRDHLAVDSLKFISLMAFIGRSGNKMGAMHLVLNIVMPASRGIPSGTIRYD